MPHADTEVLVIIPSRYLLPEEVDRTEELKFLLKSIEELHDQDIIGGGLKHRLTKSGVKNLYQLTLMESYQVKSLIYLEPKFFKQIDEVFEKCAPGYQLNLSKANKPGS